MDKSERTLLRQAVDGDADALTELLKQHAAGVRRSIMGRIPARWRSLLSEDDVMQQTFADAFNDIGGFDPEAEGSFSGWLCSLAQANLHDGMRMLGAVKRGGERSRVELDGSKTAAIALVEKLTSGGTGPSSSAARREAEGILEQALSELPTNYRLVIRWYDLEGEDVETIAARLNRSQGAVYMLRARAHDQLKKRLGETGNFFTDAP